MDTDKLRTEQRVSLRAGYRLIYKSGSLIVYDPFQSSTPLPSIGPLSTIWCAKMSDSKFTFPFVDGNETMALGIVLPITCLIVVAIRFYMRNIQKAGIGIDDWLALAGLVCVLL